MTIQTESRAALRELIGLLEEVDSRWASEEWNLASEQDVAEAHRNLMHLLEGGLLTSFERSTTHPDFRKTASRTRKFTGDNGDAIYFEAAIDPAASYRIQGNMGGAVYLSATLAVGTSDGSLGSRTAGVINNTQFDVSEAGEFEIFLGGKSRERNWLPFVPEASGVTIRCYYEENKVVAADQRREPSLSIACLDDVPPPDAPNDESVAEGIRRVTQFVRSRTLGILPMSKDKPRAFVGLEPNVFPKPVPPGDEALSAFDALYSMAPYYIGPDEALVIRGRWPEKSVFSNVILWNRFMQSYDYVNRQVSLNRKQTVLEPDGSFKLILAHQDPGLPNWLDTEGRLFGLVFWRFFLPEEEVLTPTAEVVKASELQSK